MSEVSEAYEVTLSATRPVGRVLIISMEEKAEPVRQGANIDRENLKSFFTAKNFEVIELVDESKHYISQQVYRLAAEETANYDIFMCFIMAHGKPNDDGTFHVANQQEMKVNDVIDPFKRDRCKALIDKPKIFVVNICRGEDRGDEPPSPVPLTRESSTASTLSNRPGFSLFDGNRTGNHLDDTTDELNGKNHYLFEANDGETSPTSPLSPTSSTQQQKQRANKTFLNLHLLVVYSTLDGYKSWRSDVHGTAFVMSLLQVWQQDCETRDFVAMMTTVNEVVLRNSAGKQVTETKNLGLTSPIYLVPNTSQELKEWLSIGLDDPASGLTVEEVRHQARRLFALRYRDVRTLVKDREKYTSPSQLAAKPNCFHPEHTDYLLKRIQSKIFIPSGRGAVSALQTVLWLSELSQWTLNDDKRMRLINHAIKCFEIAAMNKQWLSDFSTCRVELFQAINSVVRAFTQYPNVRDELADKAMKLMTTCRTTYDELLVLQQQQKQQELTRSQGRRQYELDSSQLSERDAISDSYSSDTVNSENDGDDAERAIPTLSSLLLLFDRLSEIAFGILHTCCSDNLHKAPRHELVTNSMKFARRCFELMTFYPVNDPQTLTTYRALNESVVFFGMRDKLIRITLNILQHVRYKTDFTSYKNITSLGLRGILSILSAAPSVPLGPESSRTVSLEAVAKLMSPEKSKGDAELTALLVEVVTLMMNDVLYTANTCVVVAESAADNNSSADAGAVDTAAVTAARKVNHVILTHLMPTLQMALNNGGEDGIKVIFRCIAAVMSSRHFQLSINGDNNTQTNQLQSGVDATKICEVIATFSQINTDVVAEGVAILDCLFRHKIRCNFVCLTGLFSSLLRLIRDCKQNYADSKCTSILLRVASVLRFATAMLRTTFDATQVTSASTAMYTSGLMWEIIDLLLICGSVRNNISNKLVAAYTDILPFILSNDSNIIDFISEAKECEENQGMLSDGLVSGFLLTQLKQRLSGGAYNNNASGANCGGFLVGHSYYTGLYATLPAAPSTVFGMTNNNNSNNIVTTGTVQVDSFLHSLHLIIQFDSNLVAKQSARLACNLCWLPVEPLITDITTVAQLLVDMADFQGIGLLARSVCKYGGGVGATGSGGGGNSVCARVLCEAGALHIISSVAAEYYRHNNNNNINSSGDSVVPEVDQQQQELAAPTVIDGSLLVSMTTVANNHHKAMVAQRMCWACYALSAYTATPQLLSLMDTQVDLPSLFMTLYSLVKVDQYSEQYCSDYFHHFITLIKSTAKYTNYRLLLGDAGVCRIVSELYAGYPDRNAVYSLLVALTTDCQTNCARFQSLTDMLLNTLAGDFNCPALDHRKSTNNNNKPVLKGFFKSVSKSIISGSSSGSSKSTTNNGRDDCGIMTFKSLKVLVSQNDSITETMVRDGLLHHILFIMQQMNDGKVGSKEQKPLLAAELLQTLQHTLKTTETVRILAGISADSSHHLVLFIRRHRHDVSVDLFFSFVSTLHVMVVQCKAYTKNNKMRIKEYASDCSQFCDSHRDHREYATAKAQLKAIAELVRK